MNANNERRNLDKKNFKSFLFKENDKVLYNNKSTDFYVSNDTLFIFDRIKEIEEVKIDYEDVSNKEERIVKSKKANAVATIPPNNRVATFIKINVKKKTFIKSVTFFPDLLFVPQNMDGNVEIEILPNLNGLPDIDNPIMSFQRDISETVNKKWEIILPRIMKYSEDGFFIAFYYKSDNKIRTTSLRLGKDAPMYMYYPQYGEWRKMSYGGYLYKLKVLQ
ncbi:hypothetical protein [Chryseobacterium sp. SL1]|uniref:hypothetical protein n=1 Tax=Chryseobacterium sp. SL1 TaxID=2995159 RepID=UPI0022731133|nr:hypothetical protein [Chryseobacterium sp. SL1]MCY1661257.1 hypothetical protein [Chryseobacterium sp. SL1]